MYALIIDEIVASGVSRTKARWHLNEQLEEPLDVEEADEWRRERWGQTPEALMEQAEQDAWLDDEFTVG